MFNKSAHLPLCQVEAWTSHGITVHESLRVHIWRRAEALSFTLQPGQDDSEGSESDTFLTSAMEEAEAGKAEEGVPFSSEKFESALTDAFNRTDEEFGKADNAALVGTTAVVALVGSRQLYVANCGMHTLARTLSSHCHLDCSLRILCIPNSMAVRLLRGAVTSGQLPCCGHCMYVLSCPPQLLRR